MFSVLEWVYSLLPSDLTWTPDWPQDFVTLPVACFRLADDRTGVVTTEGEGSAKVGIYTDTWSATPEARETFDRSIATALLPEGLTRGMTRHTVEVAPDGRVAYRSTILWNGEYDHGQGRMCVP